MSSSLLRHAGRLWAKPLRDWSYPLSLDAVRRVAYDRTIALGDEDDDGRLLDDGRDVR